MIEEIYHYSTTNDKAVEKLIMDENVNCIHMVPTTVEDYRNIIPIQMYT